MDSGRGQGRQNFISIRLKALRISARTHIMSLNEDQRQKVASWIAEGLKLSEIQHRLDSELGIRLTYMEVRLLVDDLKLTPKDAEPIKAVGTIAGSNAPTGSIAKLPGPAGGTPVAAATGGPSSAGGVSVEVDQLTRPGAIVSGRVTSHPLLTSNNSKWLSNKRWQSWGSEPVCPNKNGASRTRGPGRAFLADDSPASGLFGRRSGDGFRS